MNILIIIGLIAYLIIGGLFVKYIFKQNISEIDIPKIKNKDKEKFLEKFNIIVFMFFSSILLLIFTNVVAWILFVILCLILSINKRELFINIVYKFKNIFDVILLMIFWGPLAILCIIIMAIVGINMIVMGIIYGKKYFDD